MTSAAVLAAIELGLDAIAAITKAASIYKEIQTRLDQAHEAGIQFTDDEIEQIRAHRKAARAQLDQVMGQVAS